MCKSMNYCLAMLYSVFVLRALSFGTTVKFQTSGLLFLIKAMINGI